MSEEKLDSNSKKDSEVVEKNSNGEQIDSNFAEFEDFDESARKKYAGIESIDFIKDLQLNIFIELGRTKMRIEEILELERGYVVELDKLASEPVDIFVNNRKIAEGEVVVIDKHFGVRITNLIDSTKRIQGI
ncbi:MAG: flagellar motor switch protein FliN [Melioribacteraceae bacterium]|nr:flagellar motor switch protein FliN [Melioribacteraceae bacterium]MCF8355139.1 flagellar motor switch protein FliN [Melioribacteraceae bacterium]MCF8392468.1 flagellar motor switch protein FliN [Melioribacteraceae bacterium]MCF8418379.1 flagellar motor switch protein FliN [Melioribacteraceae bacterium]